MTFDYFNTSHLAFGSKISKAFTQLGRLLSEGEDNLEDLFAIYEFYQQYIDRNYPAPFPTRPDAPVRAKELYDLLNDGNTLRSIYLDSEGNLHAAVTLFKRISNRFTVAKGSTELKKGFAFCLDSISNKNYSRDIQFVENYNDGHGNFLFEFRIDANGNLNIVGDTNKYFIPSNFDHITSLEKGNTVLEDALLSNKKSYTAQDYEAIVCIGYSVWGTAPYGNDGGPDPYSSVLNVNINGTNVTEIHGYNLKQWTVVYLKPGEVLTGDIKKAFRVKYNSSEPIPPQPEPPGPVEEISIQSYIGQSNIYNRNYILGLWENDGEETEYTEGVRNEKTVSSPSNYRAVGFLYTLNRPIESTDLADGTKTYYFMVSDYQGTLVNAYHSLGIGDKIRCECLNENGVVLSTSEEETDLPSGGEGYTYLDGERLFTLPVGTKRIRISSLGSCYNSYQQSFYAHISLHPGLAIQTVGD